MAGFRHVRVGSSEWIESIVEREADLFAHLVDGHEHSAREAVEVVLRDVLKLCGYGRTS